MAIRYANPADVRFEELPLALAAGCDGRPFGVGGYADVTAHIRYSTTADWIVDGVTLNGREIVRPAKYSREWKLVEPAITKDHAVALDPVAPLYKALVAEIEAHHAEAVSEAIEADLERREEWRRDSYIDAKIDDMREARAMRKAS